MSRLAARRSSMTVGRPQPLCARRWSSRVTRSRRSKRNAVACQSYEWSARKAPFRGLVAANEAGEVPEHRRVFQPELVHGVLAIDTEAACGKAGFVARELRAQAERCRERGGDHRPGVGEPGWKRRRRTAPRVARDALEELARRQRLAREDVALAVLAALECAHESGGHVANPDPAGGLLRCEADAPRDAAGDLPAHPALVPRRDDERRIHRHHLDPPPPALL